MLSKWILLSVFPLSSLLAANEGPLTLDGAIKETHEHSPQYQRLQAAADEAGWRPMEALGANLPRLKLSANHFFDLKYQIISIDFNGTPASFPALYPKTLFSAGIDWTVFDGFATWDNYAAAKLGRDAADLELRHGGELLDNEIRLKFFRALAAQKLSTVAEQNLRTLVDHETKSKSMVKEGSSTKFDLLRVQVQLSEASPDKQQADDNVILSRRDLATAMGVENDGRALSGDLPVPRVEDLPKENAFDPKRRADLEALRRRAEAAEKIHGTALSTWWPRLSFAAEKQYYNNVDYKFSPLRDAYSIGVFASWTLFDLSAIAKQKEALYAARQAELASRTAVLRAPQEIETWRRKYLYNVSLYGARAQAIGAAEEAVRLARLGYNAGTRTNTDVLDAELDLFRARAGVIRAQVEAAEALLNLKIALGGDLEKGN